MTDQRARFAQNVADDRNAREVSVALKGYAESRNGLITNGSGLLGDNTNFSPCAQTGRRCAACDTQQRNGG